MVHKICENQIFQNKVLVQHFATDHENSTLGQVLHKMPYLVQQIAWLGSYQYLMFHKQAIYIIEKLKYFQNFRVLISITTEPILGLFVLI